MSAIARRLTKLESQTGTARTVLVLLNSADETPEAAIARHLAGHPEDAGVEFSVVHTGIYRLS